MEQSSKQHLTYWTGQWRGRWGNLLFRLGIGLLSALFLLFLGIPLVALLFHEAPAVVWSELQQPDILQALQISLLTTTVSTLLAVVFGLPVAYLLARGSFRGHGFLETLVTMPTVLPPVVAGVALLLTFGRMGLLGSYLRTFGISIPFTTVAVIMAQTFIAAPFFINSAKAGLEQMDRRYEQAAYTLRASAWYTFRRVTLPLIRPALLAGVGLSWARALGEFGATITFAGNFPGITQTMPTAIYLASQDDLDKSIALAVVLLAVSFGLLLALRIRRV
ncbi:ABC transporter permease [Ktedonobacter racemifer]|uniref:Molybdenum transport system permease n=1 Tax=Ktedonobacter racemifer DSM 44963 TaxID=485913 RepID=D6TPZ8_KTERA|nr:ABC transporter permease [Ktedonobacter racemifer]EFH87583.1 NifC-like ABC-type porter [Ktedonobacter racemifer DSM 44963]